MKSITKSLWSLYVLLPLFASNTLTLCTTYIKEDITQAPERDFFMPVRFTSSGIHSFIKHTYNRSDYGQEFLPNSFSHLIQFLEHGNNTNQSKSFVKSVFRLFNQKLKNASYVNAYACADLLKQLPDLLLPTFAPKRSPRNFKETINELLYSTFISRFKIFKKQPDIVLDELTEEIINVAGNEFEIEEHVTVAQLRQVIMRFLEGTLNKLIWSPEDHQEIWKSILTISHQLHKLGEYNILDDTDDLDDLTWSLVYRFGFFLELTGQDLPVEFYTRVKQDIIDQPFLLLELEEQEKFITPKAEYLMRSLLEQEAKVRGTQLMTPTEVA